MTGHGRSHVTEHELYRVNGMPVLQNRTYATAQDACDSAVGDVRLVQDLDTGLVFNAAFDPARLRYDGEYQNEQAHSGVFRDHLEAVAATLEPHFRGKALVEVGCGKGYFLQLLRHRGYRVAGIDPAYEGDDPDIIKASFERGLGLSAEGIVLRHTLEHMRQPVDFLADVLRANGGRGDIYLEVPCFDWIRSHRAWFDIFYEHVNYFRLDDFHRMFGRVRECGHIFGGQYLYAIADLTTLRAPHAGATLASRCQRISWRGSRSRRGSRPRAAATRSGARRPKASSSRFTSRAPAPRCRWPSTSTRPSRAATCLSPPCPWSRPRLRRAHSTTATTCS